jgi:branched-subunit amino acid transport protein
LVIVYETGDWRSLLTKNWLNLIVIILTVLVSLLTHNLAAGVIVGSLLFYCGKLTLRYEKHKK